MAPICGIGAAESVPLKDERILKRKVVFRDPPLCPCAHACSLRGCPFRHDRRLLPEITRVPPPQGAFGSSRCGNDDCYAPAAKGKFCCNPCEAEFRGGLRLFTPCPAHSGPCRAASSSRHCAACPGEDGDARAGGAKRRRS
ncbi:unnamed protein product [Effrenium voratum]|uniref:Uncharacterized protein n=1 Tax=Effrenium voratum TaxID=2562239 RepID=A0AA36JD34_9DINO|nr:unnamed protein product [Effrenium voratum]